MTAPLRVGVLVSGQGTNLQALLDACADGNLGGYVVLVGCNHADAPAIVRAEAAGVPVCVADRKAIPTRAERHGVLLSALQAAKVELVVLAGFDEILAPAFVAAHPGRIVNTHPSLLPAFGGTMHAVQQALDYGAKVTGCTVHLVTDELDAGPVLLQRCVAISEDDTAESLHDRIRAEEHQLLPAVVRAFAEGRIHVEGRRVNVVASAK